MGVRIQGSGYTVHVNQGSDRLKYSYEIQPPIKVLDTEGFTARLKDEIRYHDHYGRNTKEPQNIDLETHNLTHSTTTGTSGYIELAATALRTEHAGTVIGNALMYLLAPYQRIDPPVSNQAMETV